MTRPTYEQVKKAYLVYQSGETNGGEFWDILYDYFEMKFDEGDKK